MQPPDRRLLASKQQRDVNKVKILIVKTGATEQPQVISLQLSDGNNAATTQRVPRLQVINRMYKLFRDANRL